MESAAHGDAVNGTQQKVVKPLSVLHDASGPSVERNGDRGETIEDIISELNATARKDEPLLDVFVLGLESEQQLNRGSSDQCDRKTESVTSSPGSVGEVAAPGEANPSSVLTDAPVGGEGEVAVSHTEEIPFEDGEKPAEATNGGTAELESQETPECSGATGAVAEPELADQTDAVAESEVVDDTGAVTGPALADETDAIAEAEFADETGDKTPEETNPNFAEVAQPGSEEATTSCEIKAPDETVQSPRRTSRQRTVSKKLAESNTSCPTRTRRHGSEAPGASSPESTPVKRGAKQCLTLDSESDVPLAQKRRKISGSEDQPAVAVKTKRLASDSESDVPLMQTRRKMLGSADKPTVAVKTKRLTSDSESDVPPAQRRRKVLGSEDKPTVAVKTRRLASDSESDSPPAQKRLRVTSTEGQSTAAVKAKKLPSDSESDSPLAKRRSGTTRGLSVTTKVTERNQEKKVGKVQSAEPPSKRKLIKKPAKQSLETGGTSEDMQGSEHSCTTDAEAVNEKKTPSFASKTKRKAAQQKLPTDSSGSAPGEHSLHEDHAEPDGAFELIRVEGNMSMLESALTTGSAPSITVSNQTKKAPKGKELNRKDDNMNISNVSTNGGGCAVGSRKHSSKQTQTKTAELVENMSAWYSHQFAESDRLLQESINLSLKNQEPVFGQFYLMVEIPSVNARRTWGPALARRRPTVVFGGCDPVNTYVNIEGVRVPLHQWQQVSRITPTVRLRDIFRCLSSA